MCFLEDFSHLLKGLMSYPCQAPELFFTYIQKSFVLAHLHHQWGVYHILSGFERSLLSKLLKNPVYANADLDVYEFFKSQGANIINDAADFAGTNACYLYKGKNVTESKDASIKDQILVVAPHEGIISSELWLRCRKKLFSNSQFPGRSGKPKNSWLSGSIKCGRCGAALVVITSPRSVNYLRCRKRQDNKSCEGCGTLRVPDIESSIYDEMVKKLQEFHTLTGGNPL
jgi:hypothetical protein